MTQLSRHMPVSDANRLVLGLLYLSRVPRAAATTPGVPTWAWLLNRTTDPRDASIRADVSKCLAHWLPAVEDRDAGATSLVPTVPSGSDRLVRALVRAIASAQQVAPLLDQCLSDLSAAHADGDKYFTPVDLARLMVSAAVPRDGNRVLDPVCGSGGLLVESHRYVHDRVGLHPTMSLVGKERHMLSSQVARMNLAVRGIAAQILPPGDSLAVPEPEQHDIILANLPFNQSGWAREEETQGGPSRPASAAPLDPRWPEEPPSPGNANAAWIQHIAHALAPKGRAVFLMVDTMASTRKAGPIPRLRERLLRDDLVESVIALPARVSGPSRDTTPCLWVFNKDKSARPGWGTHDRRGQVLFINARNAYEQLPNSRARRLGEKNSASISTTLAAWRGLAEAGSAPPPYQDEPGWSRSCTVTEIAAHEYSLMPTSYAVEPLSREQDTRGRVERLKRELMERLEEMRDLEPRLLDALEEL
ncbi:N-6 DNA methylase [Streptomyces sp. P6-2-1]|uniref:N-6 DNA methylase n=1 Tax=Streptomyces sp. P6-2-1 TaxID=3422591 RepID=UPI003D35B0A4